MNALDPESCWRAVRTHDARFDGRFFVGVTSTRIYCRPICPARPPKREHCTFHPSAAAAESEGFRPCLRCRPELAPGFSPADAPRRLAYAAALWLEEGNPATLERLARRLDVTSRHLRRVFTAEFGVSPVAYAQTQRLLSAKRLLTDTGLSVTDVAHASGFRSLRRFQSSFKERYRLAPSELRRDTARTRGPELVLELAYRPPYAWNEILEFLGARAITGVEAIEKRTYLRTVSIDRHDGWLRVENARGRDALRVTLSASLAPVVPAVLVRVKRLFDLGARPDAIAKVLGSLAAKRPGLRVPGAFDGFEVAVRAILGQQVSVKAASTLAGRVATAFGRSIETPHAELTTIFPTPSRLKDAAIEAHGILRARADAIRALAASGIRLEPGTDVPSTLDSLLALPGVGPWTAQYLAMRTLAWPDAFPEGDLVLRRALGGVAAREALTRAEGWRPWRAYAAMHLWQSIKEER
ncbi:MAG TPA: AlkA N-terminal domain-containing protein [Candidatus Polarisedimenticolaceae bacterium]